MAAGPPSQSAVLWATSFPRVSAPSLAASGPPWGGEQPDESDQALGVHAPASPHIPPTQRERLSPHCSSSLQAQKTPLLSQSTLCPSPPRCGVTGPCSWQGKEQGFPQGSNAGSVPGGSPTLRLRQDSPVSRCPLTPASAHRCLQLQSGKLLFLGGQQLLEVLVSAEQQLHIRHGVLGRSKSG